MQGKYRGYLVKIYVELLNYFYMEVMKMNIKFRLNGQDFEMNVNPTKRLIDFVRDDLKLTGVKEGCSEGECGACTVIIDKKAVTSCTVLTGQIHGCDIITIEGLEKNGQLDEIQRAFIENGAVQCGFCTPGMILSVKALMMNVENPTMEDVKEAIEGNICRCTGYASIFDAVESLLKKGETDE